MLSPRMAGPFQPHCSPILQLGSGYGQFYSPQSAAAPEALSPLLPRSAALTRQQGGHLLDSCGLHRLGEQKMSHWCLNVPSGYPHKPHLHQWVTNQEIDPCSCRGFGHLKGKKWRGTISPAVLAAFLTHCQLPRFPYPHLELLIP